jgi:hypothetical protein
VARDAPVGVVQSRQSAFDVERIRPCSETRERHRDDQCAAGPQDPASLVHHGPLVLETHVLEHFAECGGIELLILERKIGAGLLDEFSVRADRPRCCERFGVGIDAPTVSPSMSLSR